MRPRRALAPGLCAALLAACTASAGEPQGGREEAGLSAPGQGLSIRGILIQGGWMRGTLPAGTVAAMLDGAPLDFGPDGAFFAAFDRDAPASARIVARREDGKDIVRDLAIARRAWEVEHVDAARRPGGASAEFMRRREAELERIAAARARHTPAQGWRQDFVWPVKERISGRFGAQRIYRGEPASYHSGIDISTGASGTPFVAPADGVVVLAAEQPFTLEGHLLIIDHGLGLSSAFLHCSQLAVKEGEAVRQGQVIGRIGMSGRATGPHLHWSLMWRGARLDPLLLAGPMG